MMKAAYYRERAREAWDRAAKATDATRKSLSDEAKEYDFLAGVAEWRELATAKDYESLD